MISRRIWSSDAEAAIMVPRVAPSRRTVIRSAIRWTSGSRWEMYTTAVPAWVIEAICSNRRSGVGRGERLGGLVEDEDLGLQGERLGDVEKLAVGDAQLGDACRGIDRRRADRRQQRREPKGRRSTCAAPTPWASRRPCSRRRSGRRGSSHADRPRPARAPGRPRATAGSSVCRRSRRCPSRAASEPAATEISVDLPAPFSPTRA